MPLLVAACLCTAAASISHATPADAGLAVPAPYLVISPEERGLGDVLLLTALAQHFGANPQVVLPLYRDWRIQDIVLILALVKATNLNIDCILELRKRHGWGWGEMAHRLGVHPGTFNKARVWLKKQDYSVGEDLLLIILAGYWGVPLGHVRALRAHHYPARDIALSANIAAHSGKSLGETLRLRSSGNSWKAVASQFGVSEAKLKDPMKARGDAKAEHGKGKDQGKGKGPK